MSNAPEQATPQTSAASSPPPMPPFARQVWNLARALADFVADGCQTVSEDGYRRRLEICDACEFRSENRCTRCGCFLILKARGRAFTCPEDRWPSEDPATSSS